MHTPVVRCAISSGSTSIHRRSRSWQLRTLIESRVGPSERLFAERVPGFGSLERNFNCSIDVELWESLFFLFFFFFGSFLFYCQDGRERQRFISMLGQAAAVVKASVLSGIQHGCLDGDLGS